VGLPRQSLREHTIGSSMAECWSRGRLREGAAAPSSGEAVERLLVLPEVLIEQILSGALDAPLDFRQEHDEWVVLLAGSASLVVAEEHVELEAGDWLFLPGGVEHRVVATEPGSSWLAVHVGAR
jgi:cupin 2 domain-containing protein